jgi:hypothetical protein
MKQHFEYLLIALVLVGCKNPSSTSPTNIPAKYSLTIGIQSAESSLNDQQTEEVFELLTAKAKSLGIVCQSILKSPKNHQITFNIINQLTKNGEQDPGLDYYVKMLSPKSTLGFWDLYRNNEEPIREILLQLYDKHKLTERLSLSFSVFNSDTSYTTASLATAKPENILFLDSLFHLPEVVKTFPSDMVLAWSFYPYTTQEGKSNFDLFALKKSTKLGPYLTGNDIQAVNGNMVEGTKNMDIVLDLKPNAALIFAEKTRWAAQHSNREIGIVVDGQVVTAPRVLNEIANGQAVITGNYDIESALQMINKIKISTLSFEIKVVQAKKL